MAIVIFEALILYYRQTGENGGGMGGVEILCHLSTNKPAV